MNEIYQKAKNVKLFAMDVDGILSDGQIIYNSEGVETKAFYVQDGLGLQALRQSGVILAIITGRSSAMVDRRAKELGIAHTIQGRDDKFTALAGLAKELGFELSQCAYMGDDLPDLKAVREAGFGISVPNGCEQTKAVSDYITTKTGGRGAVREVCELILKAQNNFDAFIAKFE
ncbi:KdsC family phosphatase [Moraxella catarrhalis]|uniref:3-deoxy-D-manno-octulosonate 8-phosphate phosphatase KdsC n=1 Tax=Moraxella catarrhalis TaxID=480 RepID=A0A198UHH9_MORCA|nr:HAD-IIIA family hydrolase [Moraxella catarrhalis]OAU94350.1 3-deoxy-D-manno-octulosonate 8-phosphate phosphatase [Moraxella catarrhalis]OAU94682.1 3-deoxy-D-manno-octulosonate 8-phosphate phosphatase [Moraxella catarrhalis]OAV03063.1 3-deoxy-D-manno-octulosonate 8-phosphate phosphatase [Moraxella catarrhalis]